MAFLVTFASPRSERCRGAGLPQKRKNNNIAVIGDGAITGGMAYEAMNHAGFLDTNIIVILNDNQQVPSLESPQS